jgi:hypothetical protein
MDQPLACTLTPDAYRDRIAQLSGLSPRSRCPTAEGERLVFPHSAEAELRDAIAAEQRCCPFLRMRLTRGSTGVVLDIAGPPDARPIIAELFAAA